MGTKKFQQKNPKTAGDFHFTLWLIKVLIAKIGVTEIVREIKMQTYKKFNHRKTGQYVYINCKSPLSLKISTKDFGKLKQHYTFVEAGFAAI